MPSDGRPTDFDAIAEEYDGSLPAHVVEHYLAKRAAFIVDHVPRGSALDVGCGTGRLAERLSAAGYTVTCLDSSRGMLKRLRSRPSPLPAVTADSTALPFADDTFGLTYCVAMLHHVADPNAVGLTLREMVRVTRPGGHLLIWDHNAANPYWPILMRRVPQDTGGERLIPASEIVCGLESAGARPISSSQLGLVPDFVPGPLLGLAATAERLVERLPVVSRLCAHNVILAVKAG
jgi:SAM-dependent methyltransferase